MDYPILNQATLSRKTTTQFAGLNTAARIADGEFATMENMTADHFPLLATRGKRGTYARPANCQGLIAKDALCWVDGEEFYVNGYAIPMGLSTRDADCPKQLVSMGAYVVIFPDKKYINTADLTDYGPLEGEFLSSGSVTLTPSDSSGNPMIPSYIQQEEPENPENGALWMDNSGGLMQWSSGSGMWVSVESTWVKISAPGIGLPFAAGDGVTLEGVPEGVSSSGVITCREENAIVVPGLLEQECTAEDAVGIYRRVPEMDFVLECANRLWGCRYGANRAGEIVNEIYASKLGDFKNWQCYQGVSTDSYAVSLGADGPFTGAIQHLGYPVFFRENCIHKIYGSYPANYRLQTTPCPGVQRGSAKSLALVGQNLYYKSPTGVCAYDGALTVEIGQALGNKSYVNAAGGGLRGKYYLSMTDGEGENHLFVYDSTRKLWHREDETKAREFCTCRDDLFYVNQSGAIISVSGAGETEEDFRFLAQTGVIGGESPDQFYLSRVNLRLELGEGSRMNLWVRYDEEPNWNCLARLRGGKYGAVTVPVVVRRCSHLRLKLEGTGQMKLYALTKTMEQGSDVL